MTEIAIILLLDGIANGAIYLLAGLGLVLIFSVTRVVFVPFGDITAFCVLSIAAFELGRVPGTIWVVAILAVIATVVDAAGHYRSGEHARIPRSIFMYGLLPLIPCVLAWVAASYALPQAVQIILALVLVLPIAPLLDRIAFRPAADASVLVLLIIALAVHFAISGLGLMAFGAEGFRIRPLVNGIYSFGGVIVSAQVLLMLVTAALLSLLFFLFFERSMSGRALRATAVNRIGARLVGIRPARTGTIAYFIASLLAGVSAILIGPTTTIYYDSGFMIGLKAFIGAIIGGFTSYPIAALGAVFVGIMESFASFWSSSYKEVIVFGLLIPVLLWQSWKSAGHADEEGEEMEMPDAITLIAPLRIGLLSAAVIALLIAPALLGSFAITLLNYIGISALVALGLVLLTGIGGMTSFGQAAFVGIAAYATAWATVTLDLSPWIGLLLALAMTGLAALAIGALTLRLGGHFLSLSTIAWGISIYFLFGNVPGLGQNTGMAGIPPITIASVSLISSQMIFYLIWLMVGLAMLASANLLNSREGRAIRSLRGGGILLASLGVNIFRIRLVTFVIAALLAGLAGWLYAHMNRFISPAPFDVKPGIEYLLMAMAGGAGHIAGAVAGSALITLLKNWLQDVLPLVTKNPAQFEIIAFSVLLVLLLQNARGGLIAFIAKHLPKGTRPAPAAAEAMPRRALPENGTLILNVENAVRTFGGLTAVNKVSFDLKAGEILGLIGPNGAGKSTMFNLLTGALQANAGRISFLGEDITYRPQMEIARMGIARTFQHVKLRPNMSLIDNVALGAYARTATGFLKSALRLDRTEERRTLHETQRQLQRVGLGDKSYELAGNLPLGGQRILEVARALAADPVLVVLDEPAAGLRPPEKEALAKVLRQIRDEGVTILIVEHDMDFVMGLVDRLVVMEFGCKLVEGNPAAVRADPKVQEAYLGGVL
ncbi:branched-chain amino acid ABC transporter permease/ATP-binding protein [Bradyrhizobium sp. AUGA SZCCT0182]|uniref:branched-chain amino acid ABC transporter permease/ATP-binding protein n=1 Tax=Bradyrhizobium sp. AUGA SZCCT0182 TaxID=2807667 RepID=UPI00289DD1A5|nr:branched-chain amino acid ABC transporter permease/ATP-binding protein [Bradyrhizobium sp. AUGA SZCCT0182]